MNLKWLKPGGKALWLVLALLAALLLFSLSQGGGESGATAEERRIAQVLSAIDGAGKVEVALFYEPVPAGAFGESGAALFERGEAVCRVPMETAVDALIARARAMLETRDQ